MEETFESLVEKGVWVPDGTDKKGRVLYKLDRGKALEFVPGIVDAEDQAILKSVLEAVDEGLLNIDFDYDEEGAVDVLVSRAEGEDVD